MNSMHGSPKAGKRPLRISTMRGRLPLPTTALSSQQGRAKDTSAIMFSTMLRYCLTHEPITRCPQPVLRHGTQFLKMAAQLKQICDRQAEISDMCLTFQNARLYEANPSPQIARLHSVSMVKPVMLLTPGRSLVQILPRFNLFHFCRAPLVFATCGYQKGEDGRGPSTLKELMCEYIGYLSTMVGLQVVEYAKRPPQDRPSTLDQPSLDVGGSLSSQSTLNSQVATMTTYGPDIETYLARAFEGGFLIVKLGVQDSHLCVDAFAMPSARLYSTLLPAWVESNIKAPSALDPSADDEQVFARELAALKHKLHTKSFVYDFHLRHYSACLPPPKPMTDVLENDGSGGLLDAMAEYKQTLSVVPNYARNRLYSGVVAVDCTNPDLPSDTLPTLPKSTFIRYMLATAHNYDFHVYPSIGNPILVYLPSHTIDFKLYPEGRTSHYQLPSISVGKDDNVLYTLIAYVSPEDVTDDAPQYENKKHGTGNDGDMGRNGTIKEERDSEMDIGSDLKPATVRVTEGVPMVRNDMSINNTPHSMVIADYVQRRRRCSLPNSETTSKEVEVEACTVSWSYMASPRLSPSGQHTFPAFAGPPSDSGSAYTPSIHYFRLHYYMIATHSTAHPILTHEDLVREKGAVPMSESVKAYAEQRLETLVEHVDVDCRRDLLWEYLRTGGPGYGNAQLSGSEFMWLTALATSVPVCERDPKLQALLALQTDWRALMGEIARAWGSNARQFRLASSPGGPVDEHTVVFSRTHSDSLLLHVVVPARSEHDSM
eukprot:Ihof_evm2s381 gene=Ihof_evmTU2s381